MSRAVSIFGLGYVGTVTAACLAHQGSQVTGVDLNPAKVQAIESGQSPIVEPGVGELIAEASKACRLHATSDSAAAVLSTDISFLCVGTPSLRNGKLDLGHIEPVCREIGDALRKKNSFHLVVLRSTVLPGTAESIVIPALEQASGKTMGEDFGVCVNPEFMREGTAVSDFMEPAMTVIGSGDPAHSAQLRELYAWAPGRIFETSFRAAEMVKYMCNVWHAMKVAFANEAGTLAKNFGVDAEAVIQMFLADTKLNLSPSYLKPGFAFGGSCLPKDIRALSYRAKEADLSLPLLEAILVSNQEHLERAVEMILRTGKRNDRHSGPELQGGHRRFAGKSAGATDQASAGRRAAGSDLGRECFPGAVDRFQPPIHRRGDSPHWLAAPSEHGTGDSGIRSRGDCNHRVGPGSRCGEACARIIS